MRIGQKGDLISFDWAIRTVLRDRANCDIVEGFLTALLRQEIKIISVLAIEYNPDHLTSQFNKLDLIAENVNGEIFVVEIQCKTEVHYYESLLYGVLPRVVERAQLGEIYDRVKQVISVNILYFLLGEGESDYVYRGSMAFRGLHDGNRLELRFRKKEALFDSRIRLADNRGCEYYLIEVEKFPDIIKSDLDEWMYLFKNLEIKKDFKSKNIQRVGEKLDIFTMSEREYKAYERYMLDRAYAQDVLEAAKVQGRIKEMAEAMLANHLPLGKIKLYTGLSEAEVLQLKSG